MRVWATFTRVAINRSLWRAMSTSGWSLGMLSDAACPTWRAQLVLRAEEWRWSSLWRHVHGPAEERLLVGNLADRAAAGLRRAGQSDRRRERARVAPPKRAPTAPLWSAGVARADHETIGPRVGLTSQWSTAEDGPFRIRSVDRLESPPRD